MPPKKKKETKPKKPASDEEEEPEVRMQRPHDAIRQAFTDVFNSGAAMKRALSKLKEEVERDAAGSFEVFCECISRVLLVFKREASVERVVELIAQFVTRTSGSAEARSQFATDLLRFLLERIGAKDKAVRFRAVQLIGKILHAMPEDTEIDEDLFQELRDAVITRSRDTIGAVRVEAAKALARLQDASDPNDDVIQEYIRMLTTEENKDVRAAAFDHIAITKRTLPYLLDMTRDKAPSIRKQAYEIFAQRVGMKQLTIAQRLLLIKRGLGDRDPIVQKACGQLMITAWLPKVDGNIIALLDALDAEHNTDAAELLLSHLCSKHLDVVLKKGQEQPQAAAEEKEKKGDEESGGVKTLTPLPPFKAEELTPHKALFWRVLCDCLRRSQDPAHQELLDQFLPPLSVLCEYVEACRANAFVATEVLKLCVNGDFQDEAGRRKMDTTLRNHLRDLERTPDSLVPHLLRLLRLIHGTEDEARYIGLVLELLADIRDPLEGSHESEEMKKQRQEQEARFAQLQKDLEELKTQKQIAISQDRFDEAKAITERMRRAATELEELERTISSTVYQGTAGWLRMLTITADLLQHTRKDLRHPGLYELLETTIHPALIVDQPSVQCGAVRCLGLYCQLDLNQARKYLPLFLQVAATDSANEHDVENTTTALKTVFDLLMVFETLLENPVSSPIAVSDNQENVEEEEKKENSAGSSSVTIDTVLSCLDRYLAPPAEGDDETMLSLRQLAVEGTAKLLLYDRLSSRPSVLETLLVLFFHPSTERSPAIRQCLSVFFPLFARSGGKKHREMLLAAFVPLFRRIAAAATAESEAEAALARVSLNEVAELFVTLLGMEGDDEKAAKQKMKQKTAGEGGEEEEQEKGEGEGEEGRIAFRFCSFCEEVFLPGPVFN